MSSGGKETNLGEWRSGDCVVAGDKHVGAALGQVQGIFKYQAPLGEKLDWGEGGSILDMLHLKWSSMFT